MCVAIKLLHKITFSEQITYFGKNHVLCSNIFSRFGPISFHSRSIKWDLLTCVDIYFKNFDDWKFFTSYGMIFLTPKKSIKFCIFKIERLFSECPTHGFRNWILKLRCFLTFQKILSHSPIAQNNKSLSIPYSHFLFLRNIFCYYCYMSSFVSISGMFYSSLFTILLNCATSNLILKNIQRNIFIFPRV